MYSQCFIVCGISCVPLCNIRYEPRLSEFTNRSYFRNFAKMCRRRLFCMGIRPVLMRRYRLFVSPL